jgi:hypothetical protein
MPKWENVLYFCQSGKRGRLQNAESLFCAVGTFSIRRDRPYVYHFAPMTGDLLRLLKTFGRDLTGIPLSRLPTTLEKAAFLSVNSFDSYRMNLGTGPINDALSIAKCLKNYDFKVFFMLNAHCTNFLNYLDAFLARTTVQLLIFYVGQGVTTPEVESDDTGGSDPGFIFDDGVIRGGEVSAHLSDHKSPECQVLLVTDACQPGTIWDIAGREAALPPNIVSIAAATGTQRANSAKLSHLDRGVFTFHFTSLLKGEPELTPNQIATGLTQLLKPHGQVLLLGATSPSLLDQPIFR